MEAKIYDHVLIKKTADSGHNFMQTVDDVIVQCPRTNIWMKHHKYYLRNVIKIIILILNIII